jgi:hypothetical protein
MRKTSVTSFVLLAAFALLIAVPAWSPTWAQEPSGCDKFKWPLDKERALLTNAAPIASGGELPATLTAAVKVALAPVADAKLPVAPSRAPKPDTYAGFVRIATPVKAGTYKVTITDNAWVEVVQDGQNLKTGAFSGVHGCEGLRKSVKFDLSAAPFVITISNMTAKEIGVVVTQD